MPYKNEIADYETAVTHVLMMRHIFLNAEQLRKCTEYLRDNNINTVSEVEVISAFETWCKSNNVSL